MISIGIDISKAKFDVAALKHDGKVLNKSFSNTAAGHAQLLVWLSSKGIEPASSQLCMEATSTYFEALALFLHEANWCVSVVNPLQIKAFGQSRLSRQKTDRADALLIARYCAERQPARWQAPPPQLRELQRLLSRLEAIQHMRVQEQNRLHEAQGLAHESVQRVLAMLDQELRELEKRIDEHIDRHPDLRERRALLQSIPSVGERLSATFMAWIPVERFDTARQAVAFVGLSPQPHESGSSVRGKPRLCKLGHAHVRKMLYMPALNALQHNLAAKALGERLRAAGKPGKLIVAALMRKLVHWMFGVLKSAKPFDVQLALAKQ